MSQNSFRICSNWAQNVQMELRPARNLTLGSAPPLSGKKINKSQPFVRRKLTAFEHRTKSWFWHLLVTPVTPARGSQKTSPRIRFWREIVKNPFIWLQGARIRLRVAFRIHSYWAQNVAIGSNSFRIHSYWAQSVQISTNSFRTHPYGAQNVRMGSNSFKAFKYARIHPESINI